MEEVKESSNFVEGKEAVIILCLYTLKEIILDSTKYFIMFINKKVGNSTYENRWNLIFKAF